MVAATGLGSGIDIQGLVSGLVSAEKAPLERLLSEREADVNQTMTAFNSLQASLEALEDSAQLLATASTFESKKSSSTDSESVTASVTTSAAIADYSVDVNSLATSQSLTSSQFASHDTEVGTGTLTINFGTPTYSGLVPANYSSFSNSTSLTSMVVNVSDGSLSGIRDAINAKSGAVTASILSDGDSYRLMLTATETGISSSISVSVTSDSDSSNTDNSGLSQLSFDAVTSNLTEIQAASDAAFTFNGLAITSSTNTISDLVDGVSLTLKKVTSSSETVSVSRDTVPISSALQDLTTKYNDFIALSDELTKYDSQSGVRGVLQGDATARTIISQVRRHVSEQVAGLSGDYNSLSSIGITTQQDFTLKFDISKLNTALSSNFDDVTALLSRQSSSQSMSGIAARMDESFDALLSSSDGVFQARDSILQTQVSQIADERKSLLRRLESLEARYYRQFNAMDMLLSELSSTGEFLTQQMKNLPGTNQSKK